jgi:hypothetical protein
VIFLCQRALFFILMRKREQIPWEASFIIELISALNLIKRPPREKKK